MYEFNLRHVLILSNFVILLNHKVIVWRFNSQRRFFQKRLKFMRPTTQERWGVYRFCSQTAYGIRCGKRKQFNTFKRQGFSHQLFKYVNLLSYIFQYPNIEPCFVFFFVFFLLIRFCLKLVWIFVHYAIFTFPKTFSFFTHWKTALLL